MEEQKKYRNSTQPEPALNPEPTIEALLKNLEDLETALTSAMEESVMDKERITELEESLASTPDPPLKTPPVSSIEEIRSTISSLLNPLSILQDIDSRAVLAIGKLKGALEKLK